MLGVRIDPVLTKKLVRFARKKGRSKSSIVKEALDEFLKRQTGEDEHDRLTLKGWEQIQDGEGLPIDEIYRTLESWGAEPEV